MPVPPEASKKTQRDVKRAEKVAEFQKKLRAEKRRKRILTISGIAGGVVVIGLIVAVVVANSMPKAPIDGLATWDELDATHVETTVDYEAVYGMNPPAGGSHNAAWLNCGIYSEVQPSENAVHSLEHGAVWVTYNADEVTGADLDRLRERVSAQPEYTILSPYPLLQAPVVASAWGVQVELDSVDDPRLSQFYDDWYQNPNLPEAGASCSGAVDGPGLVS